MDFCSDLLSLNVVLGALVPSRRAADFAWLAVAPALSVLVVRLTVRLLRSN
jgi:hypothetical protein